MIALACLYIYLSIYYTMVYVLSDRRARVGIWGSCVVWSILKAFTSTGLRFSRYWELASQASNAHDHNKNRAFWRNTNNIVKILIKIIKSNYWYSKNWRLSGAFIGNWIERVYWVAFENSRLIVVPPTRGDIEISQKINTNVRKDAELIFWRTKTTWESEGERNCENLRRRSQEIKRKRSPRSSRGAPFTL